METARPMDPKLLLAHESFVRAVARTLLADESRAEDVVQDTWLAALRSPPDGGRGAADAGRLRSWLGRVARNFARQERRGSMRRDRRERATAKRELIPSAAEIVEIEAARKKLVEAVLALEEPVRSAVLLRFYRDLTPRAIARELGLPVETVRSRIKRGIHQLRERLGAGDGGVSFFRAAPFLAVARLPVAEVAAGSSAAATAFTTGALLMKTTTKVAALVLILIGGLAVLSPVLIEKLGEAGGKRDDGRHARHEPAAAPGSAAAATSAAASRASAPDESESAEVAGPSIRGIVVDAAGKPVAGAAVVSFPASMDRAVSPGDGAADGPIRRALSGTDGRFTVQVDSSAPVLSLMAEARGLSPAFIREARPSEDVTIRLDAPRALTGFVRDLGGRPVAKAKVSWLGLLGRGQIEKTGTSGDDGSYRVDGLPSTQALRMTHTWGDSWIEVTADGYAPLLVSDGRTNDPAPTQDFYLPGGATLRGRVLDAETKAPIPGAPIVAWSTGAVLGIGDDRGSFESPYGDRELGRATSDEQGRFSIPRIPAEGIPSPAVTQNDERGYVIGQVAAMPPGYGAASAGISLCADGDSLEVEVLCWPAASVEGRVIDAAGRPIAAATVVCVTTDVERRACYLPPKYRRSGRDRSVTDAQGRYLLTECAAVRGVASPANLEALDPAYSKVRDSWTETRPSASVMVRAGESTKAPDLVLTPFPFVTVSVTDPAEKPIGGALVKPAASYPSSTGIDGTCRIPLGPKQLTKAGANPLEIVVAARGYAKTLSAIPVPFPSTPVKVALNRGHRISGKVLDSTGRPIGPVSVNILNARAPADFKEPRPFSPLETVAGTLVVYEWAASADDGTFACENLPDGPYDVVALRARNPGGGLDQIRATATNVATDTSDVVLRFSEDPSPPPPMPALDVSVTDALTKAPLVGFSAYLTKPGRTLPSVKLAPGKSRFHLLSPGSWTLKVGAPGYAEHQRDLDIAAGQTTLVPLAIEMHRGITVQGRVIAPADVDLSNLEIVFRREGGGSLKRCTPQKDGAYRLEDLAPGSYRVTTNWSRGRSHYTYLARESADLIVLKADEPIATRDLRFDTGGHIWLRVQSPRLPKSAWDETATEDQARVLKASHAEIRDAKGVIVWSSLAIDPSVDGLGLSPGDYHVRVTLPDAEPQEKQVTVKAGEGTRVAFDFP